MTRIHRTQRHRPVLQTLCALSVPAPSPLTSGNHSAFHFLHSFVFSECHTVGITPCTAFSDWLLSLNNTHLRFFHNSSGLGNLIYHCLDVPQFVYPLNLVKDVLVASKFGRWGFQVFNFTNIKCARLAREHTFLTPLGKYQVAQLLDHRFG